MNRYHLLLLSLLFLFSCKDVPHQGSRYGMVTGLRPEKIDEYKSLHAKVWPDVLKTIKACNIHNYSIYLKNIDDRWYLFSYFEYTGKDFNEDMEKMKKDSITWQWWKVTAPCQLPLPDAAAKGETWSGMEEVFHVE
ncbi:L-rhamnose mutarotase [Chitinophaga sp.]|uniref:L-rhamnose mutarotase n=1 Tax=Chitinophaga sp. TaxID=1869181 RepID=UPI002BECFF4B|nr:L-rhamnose mutarotase [Chitinophaga sp.]HWV69695.1 L-rhamnose mutarotase [Chitinophaga sp.]